MSKDDTLLEIETPEIIESKPIEPVKLKEPKPKPKEPAAPDVSLSRFLSIRPQPRHIAILLEAGHKTDAMPITEWASLANEIARKRTV